MFPTSLSCPSPGENNFYHLQTNPKSPLCLRILRVIAYILLHIVTLGILLLIHYLESHVLEEFTRSIFPIVPPKPHQVSKTDILYPSELEDKILAATEEPSPTDPVTKDVPQGQEIAQPQEEEKAPESPSQGPPIFSFPTIPSPDILSFPPTISSTKAGFLAGILSLGRLPRGVVPLSLQAMVHYRKHGLSPCSARHTLSILNTSNPLFLATYPIGVSEHFLQTIVDLQQKLQGSDPMSDEYLVADVQLKQLAYLNQEYYLVEVAGDGNCFYRACFVGWLCYLKRQNHPDVFSNEASRILSFPFASSSPKNEEISKNMASLLLSCKNLGTIKDLFDLVLLSPSQTRIGIRYLRQLALFVTNQQRVQALGSEENLKALILGQLEENPELFIAALKNLMHTQPSSPVLTEIFSNTQPPSTTAKTQALLLLEFLNSLLCHKRLQYQPTYSLIQKFLNSCESILSSSGISNENAEKIISTLSPELKEHYLRFSNTVAHAGPSLPKNIKLTSFLLSHPSCTHYNTSCNTFLNLACTALQTHLDNKTSLSDYLELAPEQSLIMQQIFEEFWVQKLHINTLNTLITLPSGMQGTLVIPQLEHAFKIILRLLTSAPCILPDTEIKEINQTLLQCIQHQTHLTTAFSSFLSLPMFEDLRTTAPSIGIDYARALQLFLFALQHPNFLKTAQKLNATEAANKLMLIFYPFLQQSLRKRSNVNRLQKFNQKILGTFCSYPPKLNNEIDPKTIESTVMFLAKNISLLFLCDPDCQQEVLNILKNTFDPRAAQEIIHEIKVQHPSLWNNYIRHINILGRQPSQRKTQLALLLPKEVLLFGFLTYYPQVGEMSSSLGQRCCVYLSQQINKIKQELVANNATWEKLILRNKKRLSLYIHLQDVFLLSLVRPTSSPSETRQTLIHQLRELSTPQLMDLFDATVFQAEDEHVSALSSALGYLGLCQYLADSSLSQTPAQLLPLAATQGFIQLDHSPEDQARICIFRAYNHYNCLLKKDPDDTSRPENS